MAPSLKSEKLPFFCHRSTYKNIQRIQFANILIYGKVRERPASRAEENKGAIYEHQISLDHFQEYPELLLQRPGNDPKRRLGLLRDVLHCPPAGPCHRRTSRNK